LEAERTTVAHGRLYLLTQMTNAKDNAIDALAFEQFELREYERAAGDLEQRLGNPSGEGTQSFGQTAREYGDR
jgi:hypothetical protein